MSPRSKVTLVYLAVLCALFAGGWGLFGFMPTLITYFAGVALCGALFGLLVYLTSTEDNRED